MLKGLVAVLFVALGGSTAFYAASMSGLEDRIEMQESLLAKQSSELEQLVERLEAVARRAEEPGLIITHSTADSDDVGEATSDSVASADRGDGDHRDRMDLDDAGEADYDEGEAAYAKASDVDPEGDEFQEAVAMAVAALEEQKEEEQRKERAERRTQQVQRRVEQIRERLNLSENQQEQMVSILVKSAEARREIWTEARRTGNWDREALREKNEDLRQAATDEVEMILAADQFAEYLVIQEEQPRWGDNNRRGRRGGTDGNSTTPTGTTRDGSGR